MSAGKKPKDGEQSQSPVSLGVAAGRGKGGGQLSVGRGSGLVPHGPKGKERLHGEQTSAQHEGDFSNN